MSILWGHQHLRLKSLWWEIKARLCAAGVPSPQYQTRMPGDSPRVPHTYAHTETHHLSRDCLYSCWDTPQDPNETELAHPGKLPSNKTQASGRQTASLRPLGIFHYPCYSYQSLNPNGMFFSFFSLITTCLVGQSLPQNDFKSHHKMLLTAASLTDALQHTRKSSSFTLWEKIAGRSEHRRKTKRTIVNNIQLFRDRKSKSQPVSLGTNNNNCLG